MKFFALIALLVVAVTAQPPLPEDDCTPLSCLLPLASGNGGCTDTSQKFFYDSKTKLCGSFTYYGCGGDNANNFQTMEQCQEICIDPCSPSATSTTPLPTTQSTVA